MRCFWSLPVPPDVRARLGPAVDGLRTAWPDLRWTDPATWHVTLAFLGDVDPAAADDLRAAVAGAVAGHGPVEVALPAAAGAPGGRAGIVWLPVVDSAALTGLAGAVRRACAAVAGVDDRHDFRGHVTLARVPGRTTDRPTALARRVARDHDGPAVAWTADRLHLVRSTPGPGGAVHEDVATVALG